MLRSRQTIPLCAFAALALSGCDRSGGKLPAARDGAARDFVLEPVATLADDSAAILARPEWISVAPDERLVVTDLSDKSLKLYSAEGRRVGTLGRPGHGPGEFTGLMTAQVYRDSVVAYDVDGARLSVFGPDGRFARSASLASGGRGAPYTVRVVDDSLFLLAAWVGGSEKRDLLALVRPDGSVVSTFFNQSRYLGDNRELSQRTAVVVDGRGGVVFAALVGGDSVWAFDYRGKRIGAHPVDPVRPLVTARELLEQNGNRPRRADGTSVVHGNRNVIGMVALDSATVVMQVAPYDSRRGTDPLDGGTFVAAAVGGESGLRTIARNEMTGGLLGRDRAGAPLLLRYASPESDRYELLRLRLAASAPGAKGP